MRREGHKLTARKVSALTKRGRYNDGHGLELQVSKWGTKSWVFRYQINCSKTKYLGLGPVHTVKLVEARERARQAQLLILEGKDPIAVKHERRKAERLARAKRMTFRQCVAAYLEEHGTAWRNPKHRRQWAASVERANDAFGDLEVGAIDVDVLVKFLTPIWRATPETGARIRGRIEKVLDWAAARKFRDGENPARWRGHFEHLLKAKPKTTHMAAMPYAGVPSFMAGLREHEGLAARALELLVLTAGRTGEVLHARWDEIDIANRLWVIPAKRMKANREHQVPLSDRAVAILKGLPRMSGCVFPGVSGSKPMHHSALLTALKAVQGNGYTVHGFRSSFSDWAHDRTNFSEMTIEHSLAHAIKDKTTKAYRRETSLDKRRRLMSEWARYCAAPAAVTRGKVMSFGGAG